MIDTLFASRRLSAEGASPEATPMTKLHNLALGLERVGLVSLRFPALLGFVAVVVLITAICGLARIKVDDSLSQLFRSDTAEFKTYEDVTQRFPSSEFDVLVVVEGESLLDRRRAGKRKET